MNTATPNASSLSVRYFVLLVLLFAGTMQGQILSLVEVHDDNGSPEGNGSPTEQTHLDGPEAIAISPDGNHLYVTSTWDEGLTVFSRNGATGALTLVEVHDDNEASEMNGSPTEQTHLDNMHDIVVSPDGNHVLVASRSDDAVTVFSRNGATGALTLVEVHDDNESSETNGSPTEQTHLDGAAGIAISPDGGHVYVVSENDNAVTVFSRDGMTGALTLVEVHDDNETTELNGSPTEQTHLEGVSDVSISSDGSHVYATSEDDDAVTVFSRNGATGALTLVEVHDDNESPEGSGSPTEQTHLDGVAGIGVAPDGGHVYVVGSDDAVSVFSRNDVSGVLTLVEVHDDDDSPEAGGSPTEQTHLNGAITLLAANTHVLVSATSDDAATLFSRNSGTGALTLVEVHDDNESTETSGSPTEQTHLDFARSAVISSDGNHVYLISFNDDGVTVLSASSPVPVELMTFSVE